MLAVGTPRDPHMASLIRDYETRAGRYFRFEALEVAAAAGVGSLAAKVRAREAESLRKRLLPGLETWALTRDGTQASSQDLADALSNLATYSRPGIAFLIGGAFGLDAALLQECSRRMSLSRMTLPHDMARLVLAEQIYRAGTIASGQPYHKGG